MITATCRGVQNMEPALGRGINVESGVRQGFLHYRIGGMEAFES